MLALLQKTVNLLEINVESKKKILNPCNLCHMEATIPCFAFVDD